LLKGAISVLKDRAGQVVDKRVKEEAAPGSMQEHLLKHIGNDVEHEGA
jgi:hypothetical protein